MFAVSCKRTTPVWKSRIKFLTILQVPTILYLSSAVCFTWSTYVEFTVQLLVIPLLHSFIATCLGLLILTTSSTHLGKDIICENCCFLSNSASCSRMHWQSALSTWHFRLLLACISREIGIMKPCNLVEVCY